MKTLINSLVVAGLVASSASAIDAKYIQDTSSVSSKLNVSQVVDLRKVFEYDAPDLTISLSSYSNGNFLAGQLFPAISYDIHSRMGAVSQTLSLSVFITNNPKNQIINQEIYRDYINVNGENSEFTTTMPMTLPDNLVAGTYYIGVEVDDSTYYEEINEDNNVAYFKITIVDPYVTLEQFGRSQTTESWTDVAGQERSCRDTYGMFARVADWKDLQNLERSGGSISDFTQEILFGDRSEKLFVNLNGDGYGVRGNQQGKYIIQKGNPWIKTISVDNIAKHKVDLKIYNPSVSGDTFEETLCYIPLITPAYDPDYSLESDWHTAVVIRK